MEAQRPAPLTCAGIPGPGRPPSACSPGLEPQRCPPPAAASAPLSSAPSSASSPGPSAPPGTRMRTRAPGSAGTSVRASGGGSTGTGTPGLCRAPLPGTWVGGLRGPPPKPEGSRWGGGARAVMKQPPPPRTAPKPNSSGGQRLPDLPGSRTRRIQKVVQAGSPGHRPRTPRVLSPYPGERGTVGPLAGRFLLDATP